MIRVLKQYFGRDWRFFWTTNIVFKKLVRVPCTYLGLKLMKLSRWLLKIGRERCSWCGAKQDGNTGLHMHATKKGMRCGDTPMSCYKK